MARKPKKCPKWVERGIDVYYHSIIGEPHDGVVRRINAGPQLLSGHTWVVWVTGVVGCVAVDAISFAGKGARQSRASNSFVAAEVQALRIALTRLAVSGEASAVPGYKNARRKVDAMAAKCGLVDQQDPPLGKRAALG